MIHDDDPAARFTHALCFGDHLNRIGHHGDYMKGHHVVEGIVGEFEVQGIHLHDPKMVPAVFFNFLSRTRQHVRRKVDPSNFTMSGIGGKGRSGAGTDFKNFSARRRIRIF